MLKDQYDLIVVGSGFASTFFLYQYLQKVPQNTRILVLERGYFVTNAERRKGLVAPDLASAKIYPEEKQSFINITPEKHWAFTFGFGGSSNCWYACTPRFLPSDFRMKTLYGVGEDWPVQYDELEPYYTAVENLMGISGPDETPFPKSGPYPLPPHKFTTVDQLMKKQFGNLYINQPTARASQPINGRNACCSSAVCSLCPVNAKFTIENCGFGVYEDPRVELIYGAQVASLDLSGNTAQKVNFTKDQQDYSIRGEVIALGANAIFNANILLNSNDRNPLTGKGLGEQFGLDAVVYLKDLANVGGSTWVNANGYMLYDGEHRKEYAACLIESNNGHFLRLEQGKWRNMATFRMIFEDLPQERNSVSPGEDKFRPKVQFYGPTDYTLKAVKEMKKRLPDLLSCLPVEGITFMEPFKTESHVLGTSRMSMDASSGVVDKNLVHHHYRNLFVLGGGSFTTFSPNNPTLTLSALSLMAADNSF